MSAFVAWAIGIIAGLALTIFVLFAIGSMVIMTGPPDAHDIEIDPDAKIHKTKAK